MNLINPSSPFHLGSFHVGRYTVHLNYDTVKGVYGKTDQSDQEVELIAPFATLNPISADKLIRLSASLHTDYTIRVSQTVNNLFQVEFHLKLNGGGPLNSKLSCLKPQEEKAFSQVKNAPQEIKDNSSNLQAANLYHPRAQFEGFDSAKAPGLNRSNETQYYNMGSHSIVQPWELSRSHNLQSVPAGGIAQEIQRKYLANLQEIKALISSYIPPSGSVTSSFLDSFSLEDAVLHFLKNDQKVLLLLGGSGAGKTTFGKYLTYRLWRDWKRGDPIPLFIPLGAINCLTGRGIEELLANDGFSISQIEQLQKNNSFTFILDGYDEMGQRINLYQELHLNAWKAKVIISCRSQNLSGDTSSLFAPLENFTPQKALLRELWITPFTEKEIDAYLQKYLEQSLTPQWSDYRKYKEHIKQIPGLFSLISTPFLLYITAEVLPEIVMQHANQNSNQQLKLVQCDLYDAFINKWFQRSEKKLLEGHKLEGFEGDIKKSFEDYCKRLAAKMYEKKTTVVKYTPPVWGQKESVWEPFFGNSDLLPVIRSGIPLLKIENNTFAFLHNSIFEYFIYREGLEQVSSADHSLFLGEIFHSIEEEKKSGSVTSSTGVRQITSKENLPKNLTLRLLNEELGVVGFQADRVIKDPAYKKLLLTVVELSKWNPELAIAAANSMTILNAAGVPFSGLDLRGVQIPGAILEGAILDGTLLDKADLSNVTFNKAFLRDCSLRQAKMGGVKFGRRPLLQHPSQVKHIAISPNGKQVASASLNRIHFWDLETGQPLFTLKGHEGMVYSCQFSSDGKTLASTSNDETIILWDLESRQMLCILKGHYGVVNSCAFSIDNKILASVGYDQGVHLWDLSHPRSHFEGGIETKKSLSILNGHKGTISCCVFSPDGKILATAGAEAKILLWNVSQEKMINVLSGHMGAINNCTFSPDGKMLASASSDKTVALWNVEAGQILSVLPGHTASVNSCSFSSDGQLLASAADDDTLILWDVETRKLLKVLDAHTGPVNSCSFSPVEKILISASNDNTVYVWDLNVEQDIRSLGKAPGRVNSCAISPNGKVLASAGDDHIIRLWDMDIGKESSILQGHTASINHCTFSPDGKTLASASSDKTLRLWDVEAGTLSSLMLDHKRYSGRINNCTFSPDGTILASANDGTTEAMSVIRFWNILSRTVIKDLTGQSENVLSCGFSPDGKLFVSGGEEHLVRLYDVQSGQIIKVFQREHEDKITYCGFSPDGKWIVSASQDNTICFWELSGNHFCTLEGHTDGVTSCAFSPDGKLLASTSHDRTIHLWDLDTWKLIKVLRGHGAVVNSCFFSPNGKLLASAGGDKTTRIWRLFNTENQFQPLLIWVSNPLLSASDACIEGVEELSSLNKTLLEQLQVEQNISRKHYISSSLFYSAGDTIALQSDLNALDKNGISPVLARTKRQEIKEIVSLLKAGVNVNVATVKGETPLHTAAQHGEIELIELLLRAGANINAIDKDGITPLRAAVSAKHINVVAYLLKANAFVDLAGFDGATPLHVSVHKNETKLIELLLEAKANANLKTKGGLTPLFMIADQNNEGINSEEIVKILLKFGANVDEIGREDGSTALFAACRWGRIGVVKLLIEAKADVNKKDKEDNFSPLLLASHAGHTDIVELLIQGKADVTRSNKDGTTPLLLAITGGHAKIVELLMQAGAQC